MEAVMRVLQGRYDSDEVADYVEEAKDSAFKDDREASSRTLQGSRGREAQPERGRRVVAELHGRQLDEHPGAARVRPKSVCDILAKHGLAAPAA